MLDESKKSRRCDRCGKELEQGCLSYVVRIRIVADFDGVLLEPEEGFEHELKQALEQLETASPEELEKEVYEEMTLFLCKSCRDRFVDETRNPWEGPFRMPKDPGPYVH